MVLLAVFVLTSWCTQSNVFDVGVLSECRLGGCRASLKLAHLGVFPITIRRLLSIHNNVAREIAEEDVVIFPGYNVAGLVLQYADRHASRYILRAMRSISVMAKDLLWLMCTRLPSSNMFSFKFNYMVASRIPVLVDNILLTRRAEVVFIEVGSCSCTHLEKW